MTAEPKKKRRRRKPGAGRKCLVDVVHIAPIQNNCVRITIAENLIERLVKMNDDIHGMVRVYKSILKGFEPYTGLRLQFQRFPDPEVPAVLMRIEPPTFDPRGFKFRRADHGRRYGASVHAKHLGLKHGIPAQRLETFWLEEAFALVLVFPPEAMAGPVRPIDLRRELADSVRV